jgi:hypothetical protein
MSPTRRVSNSVTPWKLVSLGMRTAWSGRFMKIETVAAAGGGRSVGAIVREALDRRDGRAGERRRAALGRLLAAPQAGGTEPDWAGAGRAEPHLSVETVQEALFHRLRRTGDRAAAARFGL